MKKFSNTKVLLVYSGGLHHVLPPGRYLPRIFKRLAVTLEAVDIDDYLKQVGTNKPALPLKTAVAKDLEARRDRYCPTV